MMVTEGVRDALRARARMTSATRRLLEARGFLEVGLAFRHSLPASSLLNGQTVIGLCLPDLYCASLSRCAVRDDFA